MIDDEAPTLKLARYQTWAHLIHANGFTKGETLLQVPHSELPGHLSFFRPYGIKHKNITIVEEDPDIAMAIFSICESMNVIRANVGRVARKSNRAFTTAMLSYNKPLSNVLIETALDVAVHGLKEGGMFALRFQGLEDDVLDEIDDRRKKCLAFTQRIREQGASRETLVGVYDDIYAARVMPSMHPAVLDALEILKHADAPDLSILGPAAQGLIHDLTKFSELDALSISFTLLAGRFVHEGVPRLVAIQPRAYYRHVSPDGEVGIFIGQVRRAGVGRTQRDLRSKLVDIVKPKEADLTCDEEKFVDILHQLLHSSIKNVITGEISEPNPAFHRQIPHLFNITEEKWHQLKSRMHCPEHGGVR